MAASAHLRVSFKFKVWKQGVLSTYFVIIKKPFVINLFNVRQSMYSVYYINTNEIPLELSHENMIFSHVKITCYFHIRKDRVATVT